MESRLNGTLLSTVLIFPGRIGRLPARSPHRPVRAQLRHTVLQTIDSLHFGVVNTYSVAYPPLHDSSQHRGALQRLALSAPFSLTQGLRYSLLPPCVSTCQVYGPTHSLPSAGSFGLVPPLHRYYEGAKTSLSPSPLSCSSMREYHLPHHLCLCQAFASPDDSLMLEPSGRGYLYFPLPLNAGL